MRLKKWNLHNYHSVTGQPLQRNYHLPHRYAEVRRTHTHIDTAPTLATIHYYQNFSYKYQQNNLQNNSSIIFYITVKHLLYDLWHFNTLPLPEFFMINFTIVQGNVKISCYIKQGTCLESSSRLGSLFIRVKVINKYRLGFFITC